MRTSNLYNLLKQIHRADLNENYQIAEKLKGLIFRVINGKLVVQSRPDYRRLKQLVLSKRLAF